ncbi:MAG: cation:proton antiporter [Candidatus Accumulibacter sp.]|uniref:monovalent cation:proton antiporter family protein n=1 Tax=Accumulibacter sp. TaxID=2053492 RepID=UPI0019F16CA7|nr:monovalent cation:proton antiporter family protein [Accumulibacter sp.]MBE2257719.1 cation:proton antiporter [Paracoccaceae bacterium]MCB1941276.1 cation:proton antiporter [Accumulibacter sp.]MCP5249342.1 cation:proton antiporter [Accumulibacter sp.]
MDTLPTIVMLLGASVVSVIAFRSLNLPPVLGYLLVGAIIGPHAADLVGGLTGAQHLAEFGVVFLMFSIGLEFSLPKLYAMKRIVFGLGLLQVVLTLAVVTAIVTTLGMSWQEGVALGGALAMSSTAVLTKLLTERLELDKAHGREVMGVLLFQDIAVVPLLILIPSFSETPERMATMMGLAMLKAVLVLSVVLFFGQRLMSRWFFIVARGKSAELFMLNVLLITLGLAYLTEVAGLSLALGAFVAGILISETQYRHHVEEDIKPFRDVLMGLFFVTIGMMLDVSLVIANAPLVLGVLGALLIVKFALVLGLSRLFGSTFGGAMRTGLWLCAGGEFGFVLLAEMRHLKLVPSAVLQAVLAALVLSMLLAPLIVQYSNQIVLRFAASEWLMRSMQMTQLAAKTMNTEQHVVICGYGRTGQYLARFMEQENVGYLALDLDPERIREATAAGENVIYGDAVRRETLAAAGVARASVLIISFAEARTSERVLEHVREINPALPVVVRTLDEKDLDALLHAGAAEVVPETLETSMVLASHALRHLGVPHAQVLEHFRQTRIGHYRTLRGFFHGESDAEEDTLDAEEARLHSILLTDGAHAVGRTLGELALDKHVVEVTAVRRRNVRTLEPAADTHLGAGDVVVLLGTPSALAAAEERILRG